MTLRLNVKGIKFEGNANFSEKTGRLVGPDLGSFLGGGGSEAKGKLWTRVNTEDEVRDLKKNKKYFFRGKSFWGLGGHPMIRTHAEMELRNVGGEKRSPSPQIGL